MASRDGLTLREIGELLRGLMVDSDEGEQFHIRRWNGPRSEFHISSLKHDPELRFWLSVDEYEEPADG